jgi:hypothetical protein
MKAMHAPDVKPKANYTAAEWEKEVRDAVMLTPLENLRAAEMSETDCLLMSHKYLAIAYSKAGSTMYKELDALQACKNCLHDSIVG